MIAVGNTTGINVIRPTAIMITGAPIVVDGTTVITIVERGWEKIREEIIPQITTERIPHLERVKFHSSHDYFVHCSLQLSHYIMRISIWMISLLQLMSNS